MKTTVGQITSLENKNIFPVNNTESIKQLEKRISALEKEVKNLRDKQNQSS